MAYSLGDGVFDRRSEVDSEGEFEDLLDASYKFNIACYDLIRLRRKDWLWAFFYQFRICGFSLEFEKMAEFLRLAYFDESYEKCERHDLISGDDELPYDVNAPPVIDDLENLISSPRAMAPKRLEPPRRRLGDPSFPSTSGNNGSSETSIVEETVANLRRLVQKSDQFCLEENYYIPIKFFMLACLSRETQLKDEVSRKTYVVDYAGDPSLNDLVAMPRPEKAHAFFVRLWERTWVIFRTKIDDFSAKESVERYIDVNLRDWMGFLFSLDREFAGVRALAPALTLKDTLFLKAIDSTTTTTVRKENRFDTENLADETPYFLASPKTTENVPSVSSPKSSPKKRRANDMEDCDAAGDGTTDKDLSTDVTTFPKKFKSTDSKDAPEPNASSYEDPTIKDFSNLRRPLPDFYFMSGTSAQQEALSKRKKAVSFYALVCTVVSYYLKRTYNIELPKCLRHAPGTITMIGKK